LFWPLPRNLLQHFICVFINKKFWIVCLLHLILVFSNAKPKPHSLSFHQIKFYGHPKSLKNKCYICVLRISNSSQNQMQQKNKLLPLISTICQLPVELNYKYCRYYLQLHDVTFVKIIPQQNCKLFKQKNLWNICKIISSSN